MQRFHKSTLQDRALDTESLTEDDDREGDETRLMEVLGTCEEDEVFTTNA